jgi:hypothetical protein
MINGLTTSCHKNKYIDYNQLIETDCLIETCILSSTCSNTSDTQCQCKRDFVVRYNVTIDHEDDDHAKDDKVHLAVITQAPVDDSQSIIVSFRITFMCE